MRFVVHAVNALLLATLLIGSAVAYPSLPARIPTHFNGAGRPDAWADKSWGVWLGPPLIALGVVVSLYVLAAVLPRFPGALSLPDKDKFLALPPGKRAPIFGLLSGLFHGLAALILLVFGLIQVGAFRAAHGQSGAPLITIALVLVTPALLLFVLVMITRVQSEITKQSSGM